MPSLSRHYILMPRSFGDKPPLCNAGSFLYFDTKFSRQIFSRNATWHRQNDDIDHLALQYFVNGSNQVENGRKEYFIKPGGTYAVNFGYEIDARCSDAEVLTVVLPRDALREHLPQLDTARGQLFAPNSMAGRLFGDFMQSLRRNLPTATPADADLLFNTLLGLISVLQTEGCPSSREARQGALRALQQHIDENLSDSTLDADSLCARFRMSRATLYRLFEDLGGVRKYILKRRLAVAFKVLTDPASLTRGVFDVALDIGFTSPSHFAARFRGEFGMSPSEVREAAALHARGGAPLDPVAVATPSTEMTAQWIRELRHGAAGLPLGSRPGAAPANRS